MKTTKEPKGFAVLEGLLFLLLAAVLVGGAYYVGKNQNKDSKNSSTTTNSNTQTTDTSNYKNTEYGFQFSYPKSWGTATFQSNEGVKGIAGGVTFSNENDYSFDFVTKDYETAGRGGGCLPVYATQQFEKFEAEKTADTFMDIKVNDSTLSLMFGGTDYLATTDRGCPAVMAARKQISNNDKIASLNFRHFRDNQFKDSGDIAQYWVKPTQFFPSADQTTFLKVAYSIAEL